jgi:hypothetical protein
MDEHQVLDRKKFMPELLNGYYGYPSGYDIKKLNSLSKSKVLQGCETALKILAKKKDK